MDTAVDILTKLGLMLPLLWAVGEGWKWLPKVRDWTNRVVPLLNAVVAFFVAFGGGASTAHAGLLGDLGHALSLPAKLAGSFLLSYTASALHDKLFAWLPTAPATLKERNKLLEAVK